MPDGPEHGRLSSHAPDVLGGRGAQELERSRSTVGKISRREHDARRPLAERMLQHEPIRDGLAGHRQVLGVGLATWVDALRAAVARDACPGNDRRPTRGLDQLGEDTATLGAEIEVGLYVREVGRPPGEEREHHVLVETGFHVCSRRGTERSSEGARKRSS